MFNMIWPQTFIQAENGRNDDRSFASVCKKVFGQKNAAKLYVCVAKWIRRQSPNAKVAGSSPPPGPNFFDAQNVQNDDRIFCRCLQKKSKVKKGLQHHVFPGGHPSKY